MRSLILWLAIGLPVFAIDPWTRADTVRESIWQAANIADWSQTRQFPSHYPGGVRMSNGEWAMECNPLMGSHPTRKQIDTYFLAGAAVHLAVSRILPARYREGFQYVSIGLTLGCVGRNAKLGFSVRF